MDHYREPLTILMPLHGFYRWNGGMDFVRFLRIALGTLPLSARPILRFAIPVPSRLQLMRRNLRQRIYSGKLFVPGRETFGQVTHSAKDRIFSIIGRHDSVEVADSWTGIRAAAAHFQAHVIFPTLIAPRSNEFPTVGYIYDFQHRHLPHNFSLLERLERENHFAQLARGAGSLMVNSEHTRRDVGRWLKFPPERILALPFSPYLDTSLLSESVAEVRARYGIGERYIIVSNQGWVHKDHSTALRAFSLLRSRGQSSISLVLTGEVNDPRRPMYRDELRALAIRLGIHEQVKWLGLIPKKDQLALLRGASLLWQPSLFEGGPGGGSVYEGVGLGVPCAVSDIEVNREISSDFVRFFNAGDPQDLCRLTWEMLAAPIRRPDVAEAQKRSEEGLLQLGTAVLNFLRSSV